VFSTTHGVQRWSRANRIVLRWLAASDGDGVGVEHYRCAFARSAPALRVETNGTGLSVTSPPLDDGIGWFAIVRPVDAFGNTGPESRTGPFRVDAHPPVADAASVAFAASAYGPYVLGGRIAVSWTGFGDNLSGIAGYYYSLTDGGGTTNGQWTTAASGLVSGAIPDRTNQVYVWAVDQAGGVGRAAFTPVLVLSPTGDYDGDGLANADEEVAGTAADDASRTLALTARTGAGAASNAIFGWAATSNRIYSVWRRDSLDQGTWRSLKTVTNSRPYAGFLSYTDSVNTVTRFYRLTVE
jgi:hypothetical protein